jgi:hypothetical protein
MNKLDEVESLYINDVENILAPPSRKLRRVEKVTLDFKDASLGPKETYSMVGRADGRQQKSELMLLTEKAKELWDEIKQSFITTVRMLAKHILGLALT